MPAEVSWPAITKMRKVNAVNGIYLGIPVAKMRKVNAVNGFTWAFLLPK
jgi:hypothetical protein